jgi:MFS family permease
VRPLAAYVRSLNPRLPRSVQALQTGGLFNAFGNGLVLPFTFIYLHNVRGFSLGTAGLVLATNAGVSLVAGPLAGSLVDRIGGKRMLGIALAFLTVGFAAYAFVQDPWHGFLASAIVGIGNGAFWPSQSSLIAGLTPAESRPAAFAMQRVVMNLGIGLGGLAGGLFATTSNSTTFTLLFLGNAATFVAYGAVLAALVPQPPRARAAAGERPGSYVDVLRHRIFMALMVVNGLFIAAGFAQLEILPAYAKNEAGVSERWIGPIFAINTLVIVLAQLPVARLAEGRRRMPVLAALGVVWAAAWLLVPPSGLWLSGTSAALLLALAAAVFAVGECLHGVVQAPLVADLAEPRLLGRYMAVSAFSWQVGFAIGPAVGGFLLDASPTGLWLAAATVCVATGFAALGLERAIPAEYRRTPRRLPAHEAISVPVAAEAPARS